MDDQDAGGDQAADDHHQEDDINADPAYDNIEDQEDLQALVDAEGALLHLQQNPPVQGANQTAHMMAMMMHNTVCPNAGQL